MSFVKKLTEAVLNTRTIFWDNPNGGHRYSCPFCGNSKEVGGNDYVVMPEIDHDDDCLFLLVHDTNYEKEQKILLLDFAEMFNQVVGCPTDSSNLPEFIDNYLKEKKA